MAATNARRGRKHRASKNRPTRTATAPVTVTHVDPADLQHIRDAAPVGRRRRGSRADGTNSRSRGTNPRAQGTSPRQLGISPRQIRAKLIEEMFEGLTPKEAEVVTERLNRRLRENPKFGLGVNQTIEFERFTLFRDSTLSEHRRQMLAKLYAEHRDWLVNRFGRKVGHYAEDLVQDAFVAACEELLKRQEIVNAKAWLNTIATNLLLKDKRRRKRRSRQHSDSEFKSSRYGLDEHAAIKGLEASE